jgi:glutathionylspermidine synthase
MKRTPSTPRPDWQKKAESKGLYYHTLEDGRPYWNEGACYRFTRSEIDSLEQATYVLDRMCIEAVEHIINAGQLSDFGIPQPLVEFVVHSWEHDEQTIYGRFDFSFDGNSPPQLLEFNADTPTALLEAAVIQWFWLEDIEPTADQFNSIHERLIEAWQPIKGQNVSRVYFTSLRGHLEDYMTVSYLRDTAMQAGLATEYLPIHQIGWNEARRCFTDLSERPLETVFKLYPWEWLFRERFGAHLVTAPTRWLEPAWKVLLSNKQILVVLSEMFPTSPYLLRTSRQPFSTTYIRKPAQGREGANIQLVMDGQTILETDGPYADGPFVYQEVKPLPKIDEVYPVIGSWLVNGYACGIGIREDSSPITQNMSRFVPHLFT